MRFANPPLRCWPALALLALSAATTATAASPFSISDLTFVTTKSGSKDSEKISLTYPQKLGKVSVSKGDTVKLTFEMTGPSGGGQKKPHQVFLVFSNTKNPSIASSHYIPSNTKGRYKLELDSGALSEQVLENPGTYDLELVLGDFEVDEGLQYAFGTAELDAGTKSSDKAVAYRALPELSHIFRRPEEMVTPFISYFFVLVVLCPWMWLLGSWAHLGVNLKRFPSDLTEIVSSVSFLASLTAIVVVVFRYWIGVTIFPTLLHLSVLGLISAVVGRHALSNIAKKRVANN